MKKEDLISKLAAKKEAIYKELNKYNDRVRLPRTLLFSTLRSNDRSYRKLCAIDCAISLINGTHIREIDCEELIRATIPIGNEMYEELSSKACSIYLNERKWVIRSVIEIALPVYKKQVMEYI